MSVRDNVREVEAHAVISRTLKLAFLLRRVSAIEGEEKRGAMSVIYVIKHPQIIECFMF